MPWPTPHVHWDVLGTIFVLGFAYAYAETRLRRLVAPGSPPATRRQWWQWFGGLFFMLVVSSWPLHDIAETSLFSVHMIEHLVIAYVTAPMLLMGMPRWMADATIGRPAVARILRPFVHPVAAFVVFNSVMIAIHWPDMVTIMVTNSFGHFLIHATLFATALATWMPILSPTPALPKLRRPMQVLYLFGQSILPTIPASFLTFSTTPFYPVYGDAALAWGITPLADQTVAGVIMKLGGGFLILIVMAVIWFRWVTEERKWDEIEAELRSMPTEH